MTAMRLRTGYDKLGMAFRIAAATLITLLWLLVCYCGAGEIAGPERVDEYRIAEFTASGDATSGYLWHVFPRRTCDIRTIDGGKRLLVTGPPGQYEIELVEIRLVDGAIVPSQTSHEFTIGEVVPPEPPKPPTPPEPTPAPRPTNAFAAEVYDMVVPLNRGADALRLAAAFDAVADGIHTSKYADADAACADLKTRNQQLGLEPAVWGEFALWLGGKLNDGGQTLPGAWKMLAEAAMGLKAAGGQ